MKDGELWLINAHIGELRTRQHLQSRAHSAPESCWCIRSEFDKLIGQDPAKGPDPDSYAPVLPQRRAKVEIALAKGKQTLGQARDRAPQDRRQGSPRGHRPQPEELGCGDASRAALRRTFVLAPGVSRGKVGNQIEPRSGGTAVSRYLSETP